MSEIDIENALREASISIACALDEEPTVEDLEHIQDQITALENLLDDATRRHCVRNRYPRMGKNRTQATNCR